MDYQQALKYLYKLNITGIKLRLSHTEHLLHLMGDPHRKFKSVHVAGTNGKGSVCAMTYAVLRDAGFSVGLYTSPHLMEFTERIKVDDEDIPQDVLASMVEETIPIVDEMGADKQLGEPTFFEVITSLAFKFFAEKKVDIAVVETGLGGRLDSTNVITPSVSVITNVQLDHTKLLGNSIEEIAREKSGIIKEKTPTVTSELDERALSVIEDACKKKNAPLYVVGRDVKYNAVNVALECQVFDISGLRQHKGIKIRLMGRHQIVNAVSAVTALDILNNKRIGVSEENIRRGLLSAVWPGRFEQFDTKPRIILDCAHNPAGAETLKKTLMDFYGGKKMVFVLGVSDYKDIEGILSELTPLMKAVVTAKSNHPQAISPETLCMKIEKSGVPCTPAQSIKEAIAKAKELTAEGDLIVFSGSIFFVGDVRKLLCKR